MANTTGRSAGGTGPEAARRRRRRRSPEESEREILDAAEAFLRERPFREMTMGGLMARTGLSRSAFYLYFRDRYGVVERLLEGIGAALTPDRPPRQTGAGYPCAPCG